MFTKLWIRNQRGPHENFWDLNEKNLTRNNEKKYFFSKIKTMQTSNHFSLYTYYECCGLRQLWLLSGVFMIETYAQVYKLSWINLRLSINELCFLSRLLWISSAPSWLRSSCIMISFIVVVFLRTHIAEHCPVVKDRACITLFEWFCLMNTK